MTNIDKTRATRDAAVAALQKLAEASANASKLEGITSKAIEKLEARLTKVSTAVAMKECAPAARQEIVDQLTVESETLQDAKVVIFGLNDRRRAAERDLEMAQEAYVRSICDAVKPKIEALQDASKQAFVEAFKLHEAFLSAAFGTSQLCRGTSVDPPADHESFRNQSIPVDLAEQAGLRRVRDGVDAFTTSRSLTETELLALLT